MICTDCDTESANTFNHSEWQPPNHACVIAATLAHVHYTAHQTSDRYSLYSDMPQDCFHNE